MNRGCTIYLSILGQGSESNEDISLLVALHSPLSVLKEQLDVISGIPIEAQVVILCDLTDVDRNNDLMLEGRDYMSLRDCGIKDGSRLTLHAVGMSAEKFSAEKKKQMLKNVIVQDENVITREEDIKRTLETKITAAKADHSYNGVIFDVKCNGPFEVDLLSLSVGGMLGRVRIYARDRPWEQDKPENSNSPHWWAHRESVSNIGWTLVADVLCRPSWDKPLEIKFDHPVTLLPHTQRGLYCHSSLPDDLGIQYQTYASKESVVAANEHITVLAGLGHTGFAPFEEQHGWYRAWRGLAGTVSYKTKWKGWSPLEHCLFPQDLKDAVKTMLMSQHRMVGIKLGRKLNAKAIPWFPSCQSAIAQTATLALDDSDSEEYPHEREENYVFDIDSKGKASFPTSSVWSKPKNSKQLQLNLLPKYVVYYILEFMHWDWFREIGDYRVKLERERIAALQANALEHERGEGSLRRRQRANTAGPITEGTLGGGHWQQQMLLTLAQAFAGQGINQGPVVVSFEEAMNMGFQEEDEDEEGEVGWTPGEDGADLLQNLFLNQFEHPDEEGEEEEYEEAEMIVDEEDDAVENNNTVIDNNTDTELLDVEDYDDIEAESEGVDDDEVVSLS